MNETRTTPQLRYDDQGRAIPFTAAEREAQAQAVRVMLAEIRAIPDEPDEVAAAEVFRAIDSHRLERPLFEGYH